MPDLETIGKMLVSATTTTIVVGTLASPDGPTSITLTDEEIFAKDVHVVYQGKLETPSKQISVETVCNEIILDMPTECNECQVAIWVNHDSEPDKIVIVFRRQPACKED
jgi:hypothetical protein